MRTTFPPTRTSGHAGGPRHQSKRNIHPSPPSMCLVVAFAAILLSVPGNTVDYDDCPPDWLAVSWVPPGPTYRFGAYIPPLGPAPGPATTSVNGVVVCRGATYAYMGFEARWTAGGWRVVDEPADPTASSGSRGPAAAVPLAAALPHSGSGPLVGLAPYEPQTTCSPSPKPGVDGFRRIVLASFRARPATASRGTARSGAAASTRRAGPGTGAWPRPTLATARPPERSSDGCSGPSPRAAAGRWPGAWA